MSEFSKEDTARLVDVLGLEIEAFTEMLKQTQQQTELIAAGEIGDFDKSLDSRQEIIEKINGLHQGSDLLMQSYLSYSKSTQGEAIDEIAELYGRLAEVAAECDRINTENAAAAKEIAEGYIGQIDKLSLNRKGLGAYIQDLGNTPEMFDKRT